MSRTPDSRFNDFIYLQAQNAGLFLGQLAYPTTGEKKVNLKAAKSILDSFEMISIKTKGNLTKEESKLLHTALNNIKNLYDQKKLEN